MLPPFVPPRDSSLQPMTMTQASQPEASADMQSPTDDMQSPTTVVDSHNNNGRSTHDHSRSLNGVSEATMVDATLQRQDSNESLRKNVSAEVLPVVDSWNFSSERKIALMILVAATHCIQFIPFSLGLNVAVPIAIFFGLPGPPGGPWIAAAYPLMHVISLLPGTRLGEIWGHRNVFLLGALIWIAFHIHSGFANDYISVVVLRALSGIGSGLIEGNCVALLNLVFPPSLWKKTAFVVYGCAAATGATAGGVLVGIPAQLAIWRWSFWLLACLGGAAFFLTWLVMPQDKRRLPHHHFDYIGTYFYVAGLFLYDFVLNQAPAVGWKTVYIYVLLIVAGLHVAAFWFWETRYAVHPLMPMSIWKNKCYPPLIAVMFLTHMGLGIFLWHLSLFGNSVRGYGAIATGAQLVPTAVMGCAVTIAAGILVSRIGAKWIFHMGLTAGVVAFIIFATMPAQQIYWAQAFVAAICMGLDADLVHTTGQIVVFAAVPFNPEDPRAQGVAAVLVDMFQNLGFLTGLGLAGTIEAYTNDGGKQLVSGFRNTAYFAIGLCVLAAGINMVFVNIPRLGPPPSADPEKAAKQLPDGM